MFLLDLFSKKNKKKPAQKTDSNKNFKGIKSEPTNTINFDVIEKGDVFNERYFTEENTNVNFKVQNIANVPYKMKMNKNILNNNFENRKDFQKDYRDSKGISFLKKEGDSTDFEEFILLMDKEFFMDSSKFFVKNKFAESFASNFGSELSLAEEFHTNYSRPSFNIEKFNKKADKKFMEIKVVSFHENKENFDKNLKENSKKKKKNSENFGTKEILSKENTIKLENNEKTGSTNVSSVDKSLIGFETFGQNVTNFTIEKKNEINKKTSKKPSISTSNIENFSPKSVTVKKSVYSTFSPQKNLISIEKIPKKLYSEFLTQSNYYTNKIDFTNFLQNNNNKITWLMRAILLNWMMEVSEEFHLKRESFHLAVQLIDLILTKNLQKKFIKSDIFQLYGATCLYISSKLEEIKSLKLIEFVKACDNGYKLEEFQKTELLIYKELKWEISIPTLNTWLQIFIINWDTFIENKSLNKTNFFFLKKSPIPLFQYRQPNEFSYKKLREIEQFLDISILDLTIRDFSPDLLTGSYLYIHLCLSYNVFSKQKINDFQSKSIFLFQNNGLNQLFDQFLQENFGILLVDLLPTIQFVSKFVYFESKNELPIAIKIVDEYQSTYEDFLSFQTYNSDQIEFIKIIKKKEGI